MSEEVKLFPAWKQAVKSLIDGGLSFGSRVTRAELVQLCEIKPAENIEDVQRFNLEVLACVSEIKETLLTAHSMKMIPDRQGGFIIIQPGEQTRVVVEEGIKAISREMKRMAMGVTFIRSDLLTDEERSRNADAQAKISRLGDMLAPSKRDLQQLIYTKPSQPHGQGASTGKDS